MGHGAGQGRPHWVRAFVLMGALLTAPFANAALSPEAFTQEFATQMRAKLPGGAVKVIGPLHLQATDAKGHEITVHLDNAYGVVQSDPDSRQAVFDQFIKSMLEEVMDRPSLDPKSIVPVIKDRAWKHEMAASLKARGAGKVPEQLYESLNSEFDVVYAEDTPTTIRYLSADDIEKAGLKARDVRKIAVENLRNKLPDIKIQTGELFSIIAADDNYEPSLLLFDDIWKGDAIKVEGEIVVAVPARGVLLVTGSRNEKGVEKVREIAQDLAADGNYALTSTLFVYRKGKFVRYEP